MDLEGKKAPAFTLDGSDGRRHAIKDYAGQTVILYFYPRDNTPGCTKEACGFRDANRVLTKMGVVVLGVSRDSIASHERFVTQHKLPFTLLSDPDTAMMQKYGAWGEKTMYGKKVQGCIRSTVVIGPEGRVLKHWKTVRKAAEHPEQVLAFLESQTA